MRTVQLEVRRADGWGSVVFEEIEQLRVASAPGPEGTALPLTLTVIGTRPDRPNQVEPHVLDIADRHYSLLDSEVPEVDGQALPVACADDG